MVATSPYRHLVAALLVLLYLFIATPVHWWHKHPPLKSAAIAKGVCKAEDPGLVAHKGDSYSTVCKICSHHYSHYTVTESYAYTETVHNYPLQQTAYIPAVQAALVHFYSNKGPPEVILY